MYNLDEMKSLMAKIKTAIRKILKHPVGRFCPLPNPQGL